MKPGWFALALPTLAMACERPVYLSFDTGHMGVAEQIVATLDRHQVPATFFLAAEPTLDGGRSLDAQWAPFWRRLAAQGRHDFGSHTWAHDVWVADRADGSMRFRTQAGRQAPRFRNLTAAQYCAELRRVDTHFKSITGRALDPLFRAPAGKTSTRLLAAAQACGYRHVGWTPAGFLGDELPSEKVSNATLLQRALATIRAGDILVAHLGIWNRAEPWAPAVLEPLILGLKAKGLCFARLRAHPDYAQAWTAP